MSLNSNQGRSSSTSTSTTKKSGAAGGIGDSGSTIGGGGGGSQRSFGHHNNRSHFSGGRGRGGGGGGGGGPPSAATHNHPSPSLSSTRSFKKNDNAHGGRGRVSAGPVNAAESSAASSTRSVENGAHAQSTSQGVSKTPILAAVPKAAEATDQKGNRPPPKAPSSQSSSLTPDSAAPSTPTKGDGAKGFSLQFGSISPGFMNGMQVPPRTSSAPPNLDEQKRAQARRDAARVVPAVTIPSLPKPELPKKDVAPTQQPVLPDVHMESKPKRDAPVASGPPTTQALLAQKPSPLPIPGMSMSLPYHQQTVPIQYGGPNPQIQSQGVPTSSLQMPIQMPLQMGNPAQVPQQVFVPGLQHHLMQTQGIMHQAQNLGFSPQLAPQIPHHVGNMGMNMSPQYNQQQGGKFGSARKTTVKITHPETHEELRLDNRDGGSSGLKSHPSGPPQSQHAQTYGPTPSVGYYGSSYTAGPPFFQAQNSVSLTSSQLSSGSQGPRFSYPVSQTPSTASFSNQSSVSKVGASSYGPFDSSNPDNVRDSQKVLLSARSGSTTVTIKAAGSSAEEKVAESVSVAKALPQKLPSQASEVSAVRKDSEVNANSSSPKSAASISVAVSVSDPAGSTPIPAGSSTGELSSNLSHIDGGKGELFSKSTSTDDMQKEPGKKAHSHLPEQASVHNSAIVLPNLSDSSNVVVSESGEAKPTQASSGLKEVASEAVQLSSLTADATPSDVSGVIPQVESSIKPYESLSSDDSVKTKNVVGTDDGESIRIDDAEAELGVSQRDAESDASSAKHDKILVQTPPLETSLSTLSNGSSISDSNPTVIGMVDSLSAKELNASNPNMPDDEATILAADCSEAISEHEREIMESTRPGSSSGLDRSAVEPSKSKNNKGKKKWKEMLQRADAQGTTSDLYMAYKGREETKEVIATDGSSVSSQNDSSADAKSEENTRKNEDGQDKPELDDWEDAADISTPKLESLGDGDGANLTHDEEGVSTRKYSRDFLLTCADQCKDLPDGFEITPDIAGALLRVDVSRGDREHPSPGRIVDRPPGAARGDRRGNPIMDPDRWSKLPGPFPPGRDRGPDLGHAIGIRGGPGPNYGVLGHPRPQGPVPHGGGLLSMHYPVMQSDGAGRWPRGSQYHRGLIPAPQTPLQMMHKAENKFEVGKVSDEEAAKQKRVKGILNKLTPQNFEKLFEQVKQVNIDNAVTLTGVINQIFDKALTEPTFCEMYANFCFHLAADLPDLSVDNEKLTFKRLLLNKCQEEFERGEREEEEANKVDDEGENKQSDEEREEKRLKTRRRMLGNIRLIGELYKKRMLTERIMHECIKKLLGQYHNPDEENIEALCKLMSTIGEMIDHAKAKEHMDAYFDIMKQLSNNMKLSSRLRFMLRDSIDLRKNKWQERRKVEGPKKIDEVHRDAAQEKKEQSNRSNRTPSMNTGMRRGPPSEFGHRGSIISSPAGQVGGFRGMPSMGRGFGMQDARVDERSAFESRTLSVPLPQRSSGDEVITLGPQGGLARGMAFRAQPSGSSSPVLEISSPYVDPRRTIGSFNGYSNTSERGVYSSREDHFARQPPERFAGPAIHDHSNCQELNAGYTYRDFRHPDRSSDRSRPVTPPMAHVGVSRGPNIPTETVWPEERLREKSIAAIKEYYSAKDVKELALCIQDLNAPSFYPTVVSMWVTDSFERKDMERDLLAKLLVSLTKPREGMFSSSQLIEGFESVLTNLEDTVNDAPKAPEFLGRMFGKFVLENVIPLKEVGRLIYEGGEERGSLRNAGLAGDVLGNILETIKTEKGESVLNEIRASSNLRLEDFRPPHPMTSRKLEMFM